MLRSPRRVLSPDSYGFRCCSSSSFSFRQLLYMSSSPPNMSEAPSSSQPMRQTPAKKISLPHDLIRKHLGFVSKSGDKGKPELGTSLRSVSQVAGLKTDMPACKEETSVVTEHDKSQQGKSRSSKHLGVAYAIDPPERAAEPPWSAFEPKTNECIDDGSRTDETMESMSKGQCPVVLSNASASPEDIVSTAKYSEQKKLDGSSVSSGSGMRKKPRAERSKFTLECANITSAGRVKQDFSCAPEYSMSEETNSMMNELKRCSLPTEFGKKRVSRDTRSVPRHPNLNQRSVWCKKGSNCDMKTPNLPLFDICQSESVPSPSADVSFSMDGEEDHQNREVDEGDLLRVLRPGMVLLKGYLSHDEQASIVRECRNMGVGRGGFYQPGYKNGAKIRLMMMCLGLDWDPQSKKYGKRRRVDNARPPDIPPEFRDIVRRAMTDSQTLAQQQCEASGAEHILPDMSPDTCIVNFYNTTGRLGLHQDRDESRESLAKGLPVVSISVGDSAEFLYGEDRDISKAEKVVLESGDVLVFGGKSRHIFHGVDSIIPDSAPQSLLNETRLRPGRLNLTFRQI